MPTKRILVVSERFYPEEFLINELVSEWKDSDLDVRVLTQVPSYPFAKVYEGYKNRILRKMYWNEILVYRVFTVLGYKKSVILKILGYLFFAIFTSIVSLFLIPRHDIIYIYQTGPLTQALVGIIAKRIFRKKVYIWTLDLWPDAVYAYGFKNRKILSMLLNNFVKAVYSSCDAIFVSCKGYIEKIKEHSNKYTIIHAPQWAPAQIKNRIIRTNILHEGFNITFAGNIGKVQNLENVIEAFNIAKLPENYYLNIVGDGSNLEALKKLCEVNKMQNILFWGRFPIEDISAILENSDILLISLQNSPVLNMTVPAKFQAYLAAERPIFCVMNGEVKEIVQSNNIGVVADPSNIQSISEGFLSISRMGKKELNIYKNKMQSILNNEYDKSKIIKKMTDVMLKS